MNLPSYDERCKRSTINTTVEVRLNTVAIRGVVRIVVNGSDDDGLLSTTEYMVYILVITEICHAIGSDICINVYPDWVYGDIVCVSC
jgi:hypothetical protein